MEHSMLAIVDDDEIGDKFDDDHNHNDDN